MSKQFYHNSNKKSNVIRKIYKKISEKLPASTAENMMYFLEAITAVTPLQSVHNLYDRYLSHCTNSSLNSCYYLLQNEKITPEYMMNALLDMVLSLGSQTTRKISVFLTIDDTCIEKFGKQLKDVAIIHDHAKHEKNK